MILLDTLGQINRATVRITVLIFGYCVFDDSSVLSASGKSSTDKNYCFDHKVNVCIR